MKSKTHEITIRVRFDTPLTKQEARYAVWNVIHDQVLYGEGKGSDIYGSMEPYGLGKIKVSRR